MDKIVAVLVRQVTVPIWVMVLVFVGGLIATAIIKEIFAEMDANRQIRRIDQMNDFEARRRRQERDEFAKTLRFELSSLPKAKDDKKSSK